jgi:hypothetical protein
MECEDWQLEVNIRPSWGSLTKWSGVTLLEDNKVAGWYSSAQTRVITDTSLKVQETKASGDVHPHHDQAKFLPSQFTQHVTANAYCVSATVSGWTSPAPPRTPRESPMPTLPTNQTRRSRGQPA